MRKHIIKDITYLFLCSFMFLSILFVGLFPFNVSLALQQEETPSFAIVNMDKQGKWVNNFTSLIQGKQKESLYFGTNFAQNINGNQLKNGAIKWRILSSKDSKYSKDMLLWADYSIGLSAYDKNAMQTNGAFWNQSMIRALLNGGDYSLNGQTKTIDTPDSWASLIFDDNEMNNVYSDFDYQTLDFAVNYSKKPFAITNNIVGGNKGQFSQAVIDSANAEIRDTSVLETTKNNKLFLLDYQDINNPLYGFGENDKTYATSINSDWTFDNGVYPINFDNRDVNFSRLAFDYKNDNASAYWLRPGGVDTDADSVALAVGDTGFVNVAGVDSIYGVRPALSFNSSNIIFALAGNLNLTPTLTEIDNPNNDLTYSLFVKDDNFINYNESKNAPVITGTKSIVNIKSDLSGKVILLFSDDKGKVAYQAVADIQDGMASFTIPETINKDIYQLNTLFVKDVNSDKGMQSVLACYTTDYPSYVADNYNVVFEDELHNTLATITVGRDALIDQSLIPTPPQKEGNKQFSYTFDGWYNGDIKWDFGNNTITSKITLTAKYNKVDNLYTVKINFSNIEKESLELKVKYGETIDLSSFAEDGYSYKVILDGNEVNEITVHDNINIRVDYSKIKTGCNSVANSNSLIMLMITIVLIAFIKFKVNKEMNI